MKINNFIKGITIITVSFLCACSDDYNLPTGEGMKVLISIDEFQSDEKTRTTTDPNNNYAITWASGDTIGIFPREGFQEPFAIPANQVGQKSATFDGGYWGIKGGLTYNAYYPFDKNAFESANSKTEIAVTYLGQEQTGTECNIGAYDYTYSDWKEATGQSISFKFHHIGAITIFRLKYPATATYTKLSITTDANAIPIAGTYDLTANAPAFVANKFASSLEMKLNNHTGTVDEIGTFYMMLPPMDLSEQEVRLVLTTNEGTVCYYSIDFPTIVKSKKYEFDGELIATNIEGNHTSFTNFRNFQEFVEQVSNTIPQIEKSNWVSSFNWGEDEVITTGTGERLFGAAIDRGVYRDYITNEGSGNYSAYFRRNSTLFEGDRFGKDIWNGGWAAIRVVNMGLQALKEGKLVEATDEQRKFLEGEMYFWRAYFHFQSSIWFGGLPYIEAVTDEPLSSPRLSYQEMADKCIEDLKKAVELLPVISTIDSPTFENNDLLPNKIWALALLGKVQLYAGSPLMNAGVNGMPTDYNQTYCANAADTFGELLTLVESGQTQYALVNFEDYSSLFYTKHQNWKMPGSTEAIIIGPDHTTDSYWRQTNSYQPTDMVNGDGIVLHPSANYVQYYGMANGLPLEDPESGWTNTQPWKNRDPRFYHDIISDGLKMVSAKLETNLQKWQYADLGKTDTYTGSYRSDPGNTSRTGYLMYKLIPKNANKWDDGHNSWGYTLNMGLTELRLADVYLMYAEAAAQGYSGAGNAKSPKYSKSAVEAINVIRDRAGVGHVADKYINELELFMSELRRERAVELAYEAHRFNDLRRWLLLTRYPYNIKTEIEFERDGDFDPEADPKERRIKGWKEIVLVQRNLDTKHYWMPFTNEDIAKYPALVQNPGW